MVPKEFSLAVLDQESCRVYCAQRADCYRVGLVVFKRFWENAVFHCSEWILVIWKFDCEVEHCAGELVVSGAFEGYYVVKSHLFKIK